MGNISIVTAFFDIGRGEWTPDKNLPHYLQRTNDTYFERFGYLASLDNEMIIYTSEEFVDKVLSYRKGKEDKTKIVTIDFKNSYKELREAIIKVQNDENYQKMISPYQKLNPEYWSPDYVLVNTLKSIFVNNAIRDNIITNELVAWIDFGYCRNVEMLGGKTEWNYNFDSEKIHFFELKKFDPARSIQEIISLNEPHMLGAKIVAGKTMWPKLEYLIIHSFDELIKHNLVDDDQTLMLMSYLYSPGLFEIHEIVQDWIENGSIFKYYNV